MILFVFSSPFVPKCFFFQVSSSFKFQVYYDVPVLAAIRGEQWLDALD